MLDSALYLLLSQAILNIKRGGLLDPWQRTLLKRDLAAELVSNFFVLEFLNAISDFFAFRRNIYRVVELERVADQLHRHPGRAQLQHR